MTTAVRFGVLLGTCQSLWVLVEYGLGFHTSSLQIGRITGYFSFVITMVVMVTGLRDRQRFFIVRTPVSDMISTGFRIALYSSIFLTSFMALYGSVINPDWINDLVEWERRRMILDGATDDQIAEFMNNNRNRNNLLGQSVMGFLGSTAIGVLFTFISIGFIRIVDHYRKEW